MNILMVGGGKLGGPVALALESKGHRVVVADPAPWVREAFASRQWPHREAQVPELLATSRIQVVASVEAAFAPSVMPTPNLVFVAVQTPHAAAYGGDRPLPPDLPPQDFDYAALRAAVAAVDGALARPTPVVVISTVLPGTIEREIVPLLGSGHSRLCYNPFFIAMGTTVPDFLFPEFTLLGGDDSETVAAVVALYRTVHDRVIYHTTVRNAELVKVLYNTFISLKIVFANTAMELAHRVGADVDAVTDALCLATQRLISPMYLSGGMGDGGACHPRDNIALSWLAGVVGLSYDLFGNLMRAREAHSDFLIDLIYQYGQQNGDWLPVVLLGESFKRNSAITAGSPALLLSHMLLECGVTHTIIDPYTGKMPKRPEGAALFVITACHSCWSDFPWRSGDIVIDPWRLYRRWIPEGVTYIGVGSAPTR